MARMTWKPNMTPEELKEFMAQEAKLDEAYASAAAFDAANVLENDLLDEEEDEYTQLRKAALDHKGRP